MASREQLEKFVEECGPAAYDFAWQLCGSQEEAKELVQAAFVRAFDGWDTYDASQPFKTWLLCILRNLYLDGRKSLERRRTLSLDVEVPDSGGLTFADTTADPTEEAVLDRLERDRRAEDVSRALSELSPEHREILTLCDMEGLTYEAAGAVLGSPLGTIRSRMARARAALKKKLLATAREVETDDV